MSIQLKIEQLSPTSAIVTLEGALTFGMSLNLADSQLRGLVGNGTSNLAMDMTAVPYCDSAGLGALIHIYGLTKQQGGVLRLFGLSDRVAAMLKMTTTDSILTIDPDRDTSVQALA